MRTRWGILATGNIAAAFAADLARTPGAELVAVGSRSQAAADGFARRHAVPRAYGSWAELAGDPDIDVVYVATPHSAHYAASALCLEGGKAVLCEKPFTLDLASATALVELAAQRDLFLMEAMWMRTNPAIRRLVELVAHGAIGEVRAVHADFGLAEDLPPTHRLRTRELGGGALLDLGVYPVTFAHLLLGEPADISAWAQLSPEGIDENTAMLFGYGRPHVPRSPSTDMRPSRPHVPRSPTTDMRPSRPHVPRSPTTDMRPNTGALATLTCSLVADTPRVAAVSGTRGRIELARGFFRPDAFRLYRGDFPETVRIPYDGDGYVHEALEVQRCLAAGLRESPLVPLSDTLAVMRTLDAVRSLIGVSYP
jgi:predicted dehydrogenase